MKNNKKDALSEYSKGPNPLMQYVIHSNKDDCLLLKKDNRRFVNFFNTTNSKKRLKING